MHIIGGKRLEGSNSEVGELQGSQKGKKEIRFEGHSFVVIITLTPTCKNSGLGGLEDIGRLL